MIKYFRYIIFFIFSTTLFSCVSFSNKILKNETVKLDDNNIKNLNGVYYNYPLLAYNNNFNYAMADSVKKRISAYNLFINNPIKISKLDSLELGNIEEKFSLRFIDKNQIEIKYFTNEKIKSSEIIKGRIKKGFFYLDNKFHKTNGVPYLWGGIETRKRRIGLSENNDLIFNSVYSSQGGILIFFVGGNTGKYSYKIEKIK